MPEINYHHLRYFWAVAHEGNLTRAAERLYVSQSAVSVQIKKLEQHLGHALFERRGRTLVLTEAGSIALEFGIAIPAAADLGIVRNDTHAYIDQGAKVQAVNDVAVNALSCQDIDGQSISGAGGLLGLAGSILVYAVGTVLDEDSRGFLVPVDDSDTDDPLFPNGG